MQCDHADSTDGPVLVMMQEKKLNPPSGRSLLLIDDNPVQAVVRQTILRRAGYQVIAALNPLRALEQVKDDSFPTPISAVITDHIMPGMNGAQFIRQLRLLQPDLPVMVISGLEEAEKEYAGLNILFLLKPVSPDLLLSNLRYLIGEVHEGAA